MTTLSQIRTLTIRGQSDGLNRLVADVNAVSASQAGAAKAITATAMASEMSARRQTSAASGLRRIESQLDGVVRATRAYETQIRALDRALEQGMVSQERYAELSRTAQANLTVTQASAAERMRLNAKNAESLMGGAAEGSRLTANQVQNLGYQLNDMATMLAMGASPFQIIGSQAGQIIQALGDGPGGVKGSLSAIGTTIMGVLTSLGPLKLGLVGLGGAVAGYAVISALRMTPLTDLIEEQAERVKGLRGAYGIASQGAEDYTRRSRLAMTEAARDSVKTDRDRLLTESDDVFGRFVSQERASARGNTNFDEIAAAVGRFREQVAAGNPAYEAFQRDLENIAKSTPTEEIRKVALAQAALLNANVGVERGMRATIEVLDGTAAAADRARAAIARLNDLRSDMGRFLPPEMTSAQEIQRNYDQQLANLTLTRSSPNALAEALRRAAEQRDKAMAELSREPLQAAAEAQNGVDNARLAPNARTMAEIRQRYDYEIKELQRLNGSEEAVAAKRRERDAVLLQASEDITRSEAARRAGYDLDLRATVARTAAEQASIAYQRTIIELRAQNITGIEAERQAQEAANVVMAQAARAATDGAISRVQSMQRLLEGYALEASSIGRSTGAVETLRVRYDLVAQAKSAAFSEGRDVTAGELAAINSVADAAGAAATAIERMRMASDLTFERSQLFRSDEDAGIASALRGTGLGLDSMEAGYMRATNRLKELRDANREVFKGIGSDIILNGVKPLDALEAKGKEILGRMLDRSLERAADGVFNMFAGGQDKGIRVDSGAVSAASSLSEVLGLSARELGTAGNPMFVRLADPLALTGGLPGAAGALNTLAGKTSVGAGAGGGAVSAMTNFLGFSEKGASGASINAFMQANGVDIDAARTAWCAGFVNSALNSVGVDGTGSLVANSFLRWGNGISAQSVMRGDVLVRPNGRGAGETGGHVGLATGMSRMGARGLELQMISGNSSHKVQETWEAASALSVRRASDALGNSAQGLASSATAYTQDFSQITSSINAGLGQVADQFLPGFGGVLTRLLDGLAQAGGGAGGGGILGSLFGGLFGGGGGASFDAMNAAITMPGRGLFSVGGYTGPGGVNDPAGIVHRGEVVWSQRDVARAGGVGAVEAMRLGLRGYAGGGPVEIPEHARQVANVHRMQSASNGNAAAMNVTFGGSTFNINGDADDKTLRRMKTMIGESEARQSKQVQRKFGEMARRSESLKG